MKKFGAFWSLVVLSFVVAMMSVSYADKYDLRNGITESTCGLKGCKIHPGHMTPKAEAPLAGLQRVVQYYPCDNKDDAVMKVEKTMPYQVSIGEEYEYDVYVTNISTADVKNVVYKEKIGDNMEYISSEPKGDKIEDNKLKWELGRMKPGETKHIRIKTKAKGVGEVEHCGTVEYVKITCLTVKVIEAKIGITKTAPADVLICEPIPMSIVVTNTGTGAARNIVVKDTLPEGLAVKDALPAGMSLEGNSLVYKAESLAAGASLEFNFNAYAKKPGTYTNTAVVTGGTNLKSEATTKTVVHQPVLAIEKTAPKMVFLGREVEFKITVTSKGDVAATNVVVVDQLPVNTTFVKASDNGIHSRGTVTWKIGTLAPKESRTFTVSIASHQDMKLNNTAYAEGYCAERVTADASTDIEGIPAILLEVVDATDPIMVGEEVTYVITATNQGSKAGTNIKIECELEDNEQFVSAGGATANTGKGKTITFAPLKSLAPGEKAEWTVTVKAIKAGDVRFKTKMNSDQLGRPVEETEATNLYE